MLLHRCCPYPGQPHGVCGVYQTHPQRTTKGILTHERQPCVYWNVSGDQSYDHHGYGDPIGQDSAHATLPTVVHTRNNRCNRSQAPNASQLRAVAPRRSFLSGLLVETSLPTTLPLLTPVPAWKICQMGSPHRKRPSAGPGIGSVR
jgi:hypothetical protein